MRIYKTKNIESQKIEEIICNICGNPVTRDGFGYFEDHIHIEKQWGYFSNHDGEEHTVDICMCCYDKMLKQMKIAPKKEFEI